MTDRNLQAELRLQGPGIKKFPNLHRYAPSCVDGIGERETALFTTCKEELEFCRKILELGQDWHISVKQEHSGLP
jgi:hypothetical protein